MTREKLPRPTARSELMARQDAVVEGLMRASPIPYEDMQHNPGFHVIARAVRDLGRYSDSNAPAWVQYRLQEYWTPGSDPFELDCEGCGLDPDFVRQHTYYAGLLDFLDPVPEVF